ncbi:uncharacterized protein LOC129011949 [Pongo pygmaeus]|uniref:uncharacterized protein LOC129011949 n=1 Tax=Pongo pygmaeus TaxID=9600 RepID=UPI0023E1C50B|nr:uncharacterized protein LOC129011949 [Pongo pygmaeus]
MARVATPAAAGCRGNKAQRPRGQGWAGSRKGGLSPTRPPPSPAGLQFLLPVLLVSVSHATLRQRKDPPHCLCPVPAGSSAEPVEPPVRVVAPGLGGGVVRTLTPGARARLPGAEPQGSSPFPLLKPDVFMALSTGFGDPLDFSPPPEPYTRKQIASATASNQETPRLSAPQKRNREAPSKAVTRTVHASPVSLRVTQIWPRGSSVCLSPRSPRGQRQLVTRPATPAGGSRRSSGH